MKKILSNKITISLVLSIISYVSLCAQDILPSNSTLSLLVFFTIFYLFSKSNLKNRKYTKSILIISLIFSLLLMSGRILYSFRYAAGLSFWGELFRFKSIIYLIGNTSLIYALLINCIPKIARVNILDNDSKYSNKIIFIWSFIIIFLCWLPYFIIYYPGILSGDSLSEMTMIMGKKALTDHHTVLHVIFMYIPYQIGQLLTNNINFSVSLISLFQMIIMALIYAYSILFLYKRKLNKKLLFIILLYYALFPVNGFYSITLWKDVIFSGLVLLLTLETIKLLEKNDNINFKNSYTFILISILTIFFRNNAIYMYIIFTMITIIIFRKQLKVILPMFIIIFTTFFVVKGPIYNYFNIEKSSSSEYIAIPLQQIGRMAYKDIEFTKKEKKLINDLIPLETLKKSYNPEIVDSIKFNEEYNKKAFEKNKGEYLKMWLVLCVKHFDIATEAYLTSTLGYWYPDVEYWITMAQIDKNELGIKSNDNFSDTFRSTFAKVISKRIPIIGMFYSIGLCFWIISLSIYLTITNNNKKILYTYVPVFGIWLTMMVATPVFAEFRYIYSAFTCLPILLFVSKYKIKNENIKKIKLL